VSFFNQNISCTRVCTAIVLLIIYMKNTKFSCYLLKLEKQNSSQIKSKHRWDCSQHGKHGVFVKVNLKCDNFTEARQNAHAL
jgi:SPX domain protein involved in polyphosphate accumulation